MTDGGQAVAILHELILQRHPLPIDLSFQCEFLHTLTIADILLSNETIESCRLLEGDDGL